MEKESPEGIKWGKAQNPKEEEFTFFNTQFHSVHKLQTGY